MSSNLEYPANVFLVFGSALLAFFYQFLAYIKIETAQVIVLICIFTFSGFVGVIRAFALRDNVKVFLRTDLISKLLVFCVPFVLAIMAKQVSVFYYLVDYSFSFLTIGEFISILIGIQCIRKRKHIEEVDFYNIFMEKIKSIATKYLKIENKRQDNEK
ncbi:hypothetical protein KY417_001162 [Campylobacter jejuni]|nr:hypothetical protein [Campylobacter jejuni]EFP2059053.1 hypothetical protein [Campylobacter jejuni]EHU3473167.1 hypothetical protein [Campylobacter jejuni]